MSLRLFSSFIIKTKVPCVNCNNYIKYKYANLYDDIYDGIYDGSTKLGNCSIFGKQNLVTGQIEYDEALACRLNESKCGKDARHYKEA
jgi:hypothetical protein